MSDTNRSGPKLRVEPLEDRLTLSTAGGSEPPLPPLPPGTIVFGGDPPAPPPVSTLPGDQLAFGGDILTPLPGSGPPGGDDSLTGGLGNDTLRGGTGNDIV